MDRKLSFDTHIHLTIFASYVHLSEMNRTHKLELVVSENQEKLSEQALTLITAVLSQRPRTSYIVKRITDAYIVESRVQIRYFHMSEFLFEWSWSLF